MFFFWVTVFSGLLDRAARCPPLLCSPPLCMVFFCSFVCLFVSFLLWFCFCQPFPILGASLSSPFLSCLPLTLLLLLLSISSLYTILLLLLLYVFLLSLFSILHTLLCLVLFPFHGFASLLSCNPSFWFCWLYAIEPDFLPFGFWSECCFVGFPGIPLQVEKGFVSCGKFCFCFGFLFVEFLWVVIDLGGCIFY